MHLYEIASKAEYIKDVVSAMLAGLQKEEVPQVVVDDMYRQLEAIADTLDEYHDWGDDD